MKDGKEIFLHGSKAGKMWNGAGQALVTCSAGLPDGVSCAAMRFYPSVYGEKERMVE